MTREEWDAIPQERLERLLMRIKNYGRACYICGESLTLAEKLLGKKACSACFPNELDGPREE